MKKVVIVWSASLEEKIQHWKDTWETKGYSVINYPAPIPKETFLEQYPTVHTKFFQDLMEADTVFIMNEDKNGIIGYIGAESFAEMAFTVAQNLVSGKQIEILVLQMPENRVQSHQEVELWLQLGWIRLYS